MNITDIDDKIIKGARRDGGHDRELPTAGLAVFLPTPTARDDAARTSCRGDRHIDEIVG
jgi:cysteinyl-tRNA synthetase